MSTFIAFIAPYLYLIGLTGTLIYVFKRKYNFQFLLPIALIAATLLVFFLGFVFHNLTIGVIATVLAALAFIPLLILDKDRWNTLRTLVLTPGFVLFTLLYTILFVYHFNTFPQMFSDDMMHWAPHVWTMWLRDDFYTSPDLSIVTHGDYQPILQLFQLIFIKVAGVYKEGLLFIALELSCFAMLFPLLKNLTWNKNKRLQTAVLMFSIFISMLIVPTLIDVTHIFYNALHPDYAIAFVFLLGLFIAFTQSDRFDWRIALILSLVVTFLSLTKQSSVLFGGLVVLIYLVGLYFGYKITFKKLKRNTTVFMKQWRRNWWRIGLGLLLLLLPFISLKLWQAQIKGFENPYCCVAIFGISPSDATKVPGVLLKKDGNESQQKYAREFFRYIATYQAGFTTHILSSVSYLQFMLLFIAVIAFIGYNYRDKFRRSKFLIAALILVAGWFIYCFAIYLTFLFGGMIDSERDNLLTGDRYLRTYIFTLLLSLFAVVVYVVIDRFNQEKKKSKSLLIFVVSSLVIAGTLLNVDIIKGGYLTETRKFNGEYVAAGIDNKNELLKRLRAFTQSIGGSFENPKHIAVTTQEGASSSYFLRYAAIPNRIDNGSDLILHPSTSKQKACEILAKNDFLYIQYIGNEEASLEKLNSCLSIPVTSISQYDAFKIEKDGKSFRLTKVNYE